MKRAVYIPIGFLSVFSCAVWTPPADAADQLPKRKPGLWEITVAQEGIPPHAMKQCIDEKTDAKMQQTGVEMAERMGGKCPKNSLTKTAQGYDGESECQFAGTSMSSKSSFKGDFQSAYSGEVQTSYDPPFMGKGSTKASITAKWLGNCTEGMVPGDMLLPNGVKMNIDQMAALAQQGAAAARNPQIQEMMKNRIDMERMKAHVADETQRMQQEGGAAKPTK